MEFLSEEDQFKDGLNSEEIGRIKDYELRQIRSQYRQEFIKAFEDEEGISDFILESVLNEITARERKAIEEYKRRKNIV